jgi:hypothetical protein
MITIYVQFHENAKTMIGFNYLLIEVKAKLLVKAY